MFAIAWQYLSGQATSTDPTDREHRAPWPPNPDQVFQALVASWGERGCSPDERAILEWLEVLGAPQLATPDEAAISRGAAVKVYVPVNDLEGPTRGPYREDHLGLLPDRRPHKERYFPTVHVGEAVCVLIWPEVVLPAERRASLTTLCTGVTHVGHPRSLVRMWVPDQLPVPTWVPTADPRSRELSLRVPHAGRLAALVAAYADGGLAWRRPPAAPWQGYARVMADPGPPHSVFDRRLVVLRKVGGEGCPSLLQAPAFVRALRGTILAASDDRARPLVSGHEADGRPLRRPHVSWVPLAHVGHDFATGHLLGMAIALSIGLSPEDEQAVLEAVASGFHPDTGELTLRAGAAGAMVLVGEDRPAPPHALRPSTWTGPAAVWGSVTPIVLDRLPPRRRQDHDAWAASQLTEACVRQGVPAPSELEVLPVSPHRGAPPCRAFPPLRRKPDDGCRWHVHAVLRFPLPVEGPLLLGAGRYQGYGLCKPLAPET